jgi:hypothetical protein
LGRGHARLHRGGLGGRSLLHKNRQARCDPSQGAPYHRVNHGTHGTSPCIRRILSFTRNILDSILMIEVSVPRINGPDSEKER